MEKETLKNRIIIGLSRNLVNNDAHSLRKVISDSLRDIATVFAADRALIFLTDPRSDTFSVTHEWHREGLLSVTNSLQQLNLRDYQIWGKFSTPGNCFQISNTLNIPDTYPYDSKLFRVTHCKAFIQKALAFDDNKTGFVALLSNHVGHKWDAAFEDFLEITAELLKNLILKLELLNNGNDKKDAGVNQNFLRSSGKTDNEIAEVFDKLYGSLHYGILLFDTALQEFEYANPKSMEFLGLHKTDDALKNTLFQVFSNNGYNTDEFFSATHQQKNKDFAFHLKDKYFNGSISPVKNSSWVVMSITDITTIAHYEKTEKHFNKQIQVLNEAAIDLIASLRTEEELFNFIGQTAYDLIENSVVLVNRYNPEEEYLQTVFAEGFGSNMNIISQLIGKHPLHKKYPLKKGGELYNKIIKLRVKENTRGIHELTFGTIAEPVARKIEKILNVDRFFSCGLYAGKKLYGTVSFLTRPGTEINAYILDAFGRMISNASYGFDMRNRLIKTSGMLSDAASLAKIWYWGFDFKSRCFILSRKLFEKLEPEISNEDDEQDIAIPMEEFLDRYTPAEEVSKITKAIEAAIEHQNEVAYELELELKLVTSHKKNLFVYTRGTLQKDEKIIGVAQDISELKKAQRNLTESELKFKNLVEQSLDAIVVVKEDGIITEWNPSAELITGLNSETVTGKYAWEIESSILFNPALQKQHPQQPPQKLKERFFRFFRSNDTREPLVSEITIRNSAGKLLHLSLTSFVFTAGQNKFLCRISKDITLEKQKQEQKKQEEILQRTAQAKDLFLDNMSHEMRTPLSGIIGMSDMLMHSQLNDSQKEMLKVVKESSDSLLELISNIHELSRLESEGIVIRNKPFNIEVMMEKAISIFKASAIQKHITLRVENHIQYKGMLLGDEFRLRQIIGNLLANAIKFTYSGGEVVLIAWGSIQKDNTMEVRVEVKDNGIGIDREIIPVLFEKFTQADQSYTREYDGAGIGLYICRELVTLMEGKIGVESEQHRGSTFWIQLPLTLVSE